MALHKEIQRDLKEMARDLRGPDDVAQWITFGTLTVPCIPTSIEDTVVIDSDGNEAHLRHSVIVSTEWWEAPGLEVLDADSMPGEDTANVTRFPNVGEVIRFRAGFYKIVQRKFDSTLAQMRLDLADPGSNQ